MVIGVDPGSRDGAIVVLDRDGKTVWDWAVWWTIGKPTHARVRARYGWRPGDFKLRHLSDVARPFVGIQESYVLAIEGLRAYPGRSNHQALLRLAYAAGQVGGVLEAGAMEVLRPLAVDWRRTVLGLAPKVSAKACEARAVEMAPRLFVWPGGFPGSLRDGPGGLRADARGALAEAACIARYAAVTRGRG